MSVLSVDDQILYTFAGVASMVVREMGEMLYTIGKKEHRNSVNIIMEEMILQLTAN